MKISIISLTLKGGGAEKVAVNLANYYSSIGYDVDMVLLKKIGQYLSLVNQNVKIVDLSTSSYFLSTFKLRSYLKRNKNNFILSVIRGANILVGLASVGFKIKYLTYREANTLDGINRMKNLKKFIYKTLMQFSYGKACYVIANSHDTKKDLVNDKIVDDTKIIVVVNPVLPLNYQQLARQDCSHEWLNNNDLKIVLTVARLHEQKNYPFLIDCFSEVIKQYNCARLIIVGEGKEREKLQKQIESLNMQKYINLENFQSNIFPYYLKASVFALCSLWEGFGNVIVEALSVGTPVVCTNCPGGPKMILENGEYGRLVEIGDKRGYVEALMHELGNIDGDKKNIKLIKYAQKFSVQSIGDEYLNVIKRGCVKLNKA